MKQPPLAPATVDKWGNTVPRYLRVYDNGGETADRYTVCFTKKRVCGQFMYIGIGPSFYVHGASNIPIDRPGYSHLGKPISFNGLPIGLRMQVLGEYVEMWCGVDDVSPNEIHLVYEMYMTEDGEVVDRPLGYATDYNHAALCLMNPDKAVGCLPVLLNAQGHTCGVVNSNKKELIKAASAYRKENGLD